MKSEKDIELDIVLDEYYKKFDKNYPLVITSLMTMDEIIKDVKKYIEKGKPKPEPKLNSRYVY